MKMNAFPTIVLVPGAFHLQPAMDIFSKELNKVGFDTQSFGLPTVDHPELTIQDDAAALKDKVLYPLIEQEGKEVVLYLHSYAGFPGSTAIEGYSKAERLRSGKPGGIIGLIYQSAFIPTKGDTLLKMIGGQWAPWQDVHENTGLISAIDPKKTFWADAAEPFATKALDLIRQQSLRSFTTPSPAVYYGIKEYDYRRVYIHTIQDQALPPFAQDAYVDGSGVKWDVYRLDTSHDPFFSEPQKLVEIVVGKLAAFKMTF